MRAMKRIASVVLAMVMVLAMAVPVMAAGETQKTGTIKFENASADHTYKLYQIFTGDEYTKDGKKILSNVVYGQSYGKLGDKVPADVLEQIKNENDANAYIAKIKDQLTNPYETLSEATSAEWKVPAGYYVIIDETALKAGVNDAISAYMVEVVGGEVTVKTKTGTPSLDKQVQEKNDSLAEDAGNPTWGKKADYDIGDHVPFALKATVPVGMEEALKAYTEYYMQFQDTLSSGLTLDKDSIKVTMQTAGGETVELHEGVDYALSVSGQSFTVTINDAKKIEGFAAGAVFTVSYTATLNEDAVIGGSGNLNTAALEFSNDPNSDSHGKTPDNKVTVFTFNVVANKVDGKEQPLAGAEFTLYKWVAGEGESAIEAGAPSGFEGSGHWVKEEAAIVSDVAGSEVKGTVFTFKGLDAGYYKMVESETPDGYNTIDPVDFKLEATYNDATPPELTDFTVNGKSGDNIIKFTAVSSTGTATADIVNQEGAQLPETGGMGTTIFYVVGAILILGAGILLVTNKRMSK